MIIGNFTPNSVICTRDLVVVVESVESVVLREFVVLVGDLDHVDPMDLLDLRDLKENVVVADMMA